MKRNRIMIAAPKSGSGKTLVTCALLQLLKNNGWQVTSCKCGPDYIDPMFHEKVIGVPAKNLDTFFTGEEQTVKLFLKCIAQNDAKRSDAEQDSTEWDNFGWKSTERNESGQNSLVVMEGVMGLYDGLGGVREEGSSYHLAKVTKTPIVLVVDARGMGRSVISLTAGFLDHDRERLIRGVLLNRISKGCYEIIKPLIEEELKLPVAGFLPDKGELHIESRHLGLILPDELNGIEEKLQTLAEEFSITVSMEKILEIAESAEETEDSAAAAGKEQNTDERIQEAENRPVIAVARDEVFCFYYADNLLTIEEHGAEIKYFSPLRDEGLPEGCHGLLIGGGYPELYAEKLSGNRRMLAAVKDAVESGMPVVAECGGFMYLHSVMADKDGNYYNMAGVVPATCFYVGKLVRFGYIELQEKQSSFLPQGEKIRGHKFHYYDSTDNGDDAVATKPVTGKEYSCIIEDETRWMGFPHLYYPSNPALAKAFVAKAEKYRKTFQLE